MKSCFFFARFQSTSAVILTLAVLISGRNAAGDDIRFSRDVLPVLSENCFFCHGPDEGQRQAELRLDKESGALEALSRSRPADSALLQRILSDDPDEMMPPPDSNRRLTEQQKRTLQRWIESGAQWGRHWSFEPLASPAVPEPAFPEVPVHNPVDAFVQRKLKRKGLSPSPQAARHTLLRRVTLDLTGLPPSPAEVRAFISDDSSDAYEKVVDRLLESDAYGERMAWDWLDAARYADSNGYQGDRERTMWPWRDWVVRAFNRNMPFDQFSTLQLAGDLLPNATFEQKLATGFCRNHMINGEGGRIPEENRVDYVMDMTETMGTVWLGLTLNCCRCHDHKYDPLTQQEYYQFFDFFNQTPVSGGGGDPQTAPNMLAPTAEQQRQLAEIVASRTEKQAASAAREKELLIDQGKWEKTTLAMGDAGDWTVLRPKTASAEKQTLTVLDDQSILVGGENAVNDSYTIEYELPALPPSSIRLDALRHPTMTKGGLARSDSGNFVLTEIEFTLIQDGKRSRLQPAQAEATFEQGVYKIPGTFDGNNSSGWAVYEGRPVDRDHAAVFRLDSLPQVTAGAVLEVVLRHDSVHKFHNLGRFRISVSERKEAPLESTRAGLLADLRIPPAKRSKEQADRIRKTWLQSDQRWSALQKEISELSAREDRIRKQAARVMIMADMPKPRNTFVLNRGLYNSPTEKQVVAATPSSLPELKVGRGDRMTRLQLARWLFAADHPLTARVTVNRFWQQVFGTGLVKTVEDFGVQAEYPEYRDLLDWLAVDFRDNGWDIKRLMKTMVLSHTYRQSSAYRLVATETGDELSLAEVDPQNRLLARAPRYRMPSWMLRDYALAASGLMNPRLGGPPVRTYQPAGVWEEATFGRKVYNQDAGDQLYRRSLYIFWRRIIAPTMFFDNASRQTCTVKSLRTNTPLHALLTLNETTFVESSRLLAQNLLADPQTTNDSARMQYAFLRILGRRATDDELAVLLNGLKRSRREYAENQSAAVELMAVGDSKRDASLPVTEHAAWTSVCLALFNLDETLNRE